MGRQGCWGVRLSLAPEGHLFLFLRAQNSNTREAGVLSSTPNQGPCPGDPTEGEGLLPPSLLEAEPLRLVPSQGLGPSSWVRITLRCLCLTETPRSAGQPRGHGRFWGLLLGGVAPFVLDKT